MIERERERESVARERGAYKVRLHTRKTFYAKNISRVFLYSQTFLRFTDDFEFHVVVSIIERDTSIIVTHTR